MIKSCTAIAAFLCAALELLLRSTLLRVFP